MCEFFDNPFRFMSTLEETCYNDCELFSRQIDDWEETPIYMRPRLRDIGL